MNRNTSASFDVTVVGAGHAGCEAALAAARMGVRTALVTQSLEQAGFMPCNPAVGGIAKSHLVFELDALGGEMARNTDYTGIQFRVLNTRKGPAVRANRVQCDKEAYSRRMATVLRRTPGLVLIEGMCCGLVIKNGRLQGIRMADDTVLSALAVVLTPGTFLAGRIHVGQESWSGGRNGVIAGDDLSACLKTLGFHIARLKTGTPARLRKDSIDCSRMEIQPGTVPAPFLSWEVRRTAPMFHVEHPGVDPLVPWLPGADQMPCYLTHTTEKTHEIIQANLRKSSLYGGQITGTGVRYCPSIEDKIVKFPDKASHHVFIEPEGRNTDLVYPNGTSNSLPRDAQLELIHSIPGLESAVVENWAYAIEYDFCDPTQLRNSLETKLIENLYFAGQINGTTGYEEAAAQGFLAGVNAAGKALGRDPIVIGRHEGYIGVLIDDLVTKGTDEPYRMFTSRAEYRLLLRQDNARYRMLPFARTIGLAFGDMLSETERFAREISDEICRLGSVRHGEVLLDQLLKRPDMKYRNLPSARTDLCDEIAEQVEIALKYEGYIAQENRRVSRMMELARIRLPADLDYFRIRSLKYEAREKLARIRPANLDQASRIAGISPADISVLLVALKAR